jgi:signal transduction histidine kinase
VDDLGQSIELGASLVSDLLAFGREQRPEPAHRLDLAGAIRALAPQLARLAGRDREFRVEVPARRRVVELAQGELEQLLANLVINAADATVPGDRISIRLSDVRIDEGDARDIAPGTYHRITVSDTGSGMDPATLERAFEPFFTTKPHGTGIGLSSVYGTVRHAGGAVRIGSEPGVGTWVDLLLPHAQRARRNPG